MHAACSSSSKLTAKSGGPRPFFIAVAGRREVTEEGRHHQKCRASRKEKKSVNVFLILLIVLAALDLLLLQICLCLA